MDARRRRFARFAWAVLAVTVGVILWGGYVRASGSGAGCGAHWPLCNGVVVPHSPTAETLIELGHRLTSGALGFLVLGLVVAAFRIYPRGSHVRRAAVAVGVLTIVEAALGAGLVKFEYVAFDAREARAYWMGAHLANTFLLLGAATLTAWWASGHPPLRLRGSGRRGLALGLAIVCTLLLGVSGAVTALGDTLALRGGLDPARHAVVATLVSLRLYHPLFACVVLGLVAWATAEARRTGPPASRLATGVLALFGTQMLLGLLNVTLRAPVPVQIAHLLVTDLIWIGLVLTAASALAVPVGTRGETSQRVRESVPV
ncbi:MAG TPA: COX15/CtaA family protein [Rhodothermales bacterium]|nr:COX15/CtaA family protein [Rhodothermales bacterium]